MNPLLMMAIPGAVKTGIDLFRKPRSGMVNPRGYKNQMLFDEGAHRQQALRNIGAVNMANIANIKQEGAAGRLPSGAIMSRVQGVGYKGAQAAGEIEPELGEAKRKSYLDYFDRVNQYGVAEQEAKQGKFDTLMGNLGQMSKLGLLWKAGYFDQPGGDDDWQTMNQASFGGSVPKRNQIRGTMSGASLAG